jgi:hypothetical protein
MSVIDITRRQAKKLESQQAFKLAGLLKSDGRRKIAYG